MCSGISILSRAAGLSGSVGHATLKWPGIRESGVASPASSAVCREAVRRFSAAPLGYRLSAALIAWSTESLGSLGCCTVIGGN